MGAGNKRLFGTDGIRGVANTELTPELALSVGRAAAIALGSSASRPRFVLARDTRMSGEMLESALAAGLLSAGADVIRCEVLPTPAVAFLVTETGASAGVVISASHNPVDDNGIKFFGADGYKLSEAEEAKIESSVEATSGRPTGAHVGRLGFLTDGPELYIEHALKALEPVKGASGPQIADSVSLEGLKVVVDCAFGAAFFTTPEALRRAGAEVIELHCEPDGARINVASGSAAPGLVAEEVLRTGADAGLAHDGDADRVIAIDEAGAIVDGDALIAALAIELKQARRLKNNAVVATVMANLGFRAAMSEAEIEIIETAVGDRNVLKAMLTSGSVIGGEQSGHIILLDHATTGDGLIAGLKLLGRMASTGRKLSELASVVKKFPQVLLNVAVGDRGQLEAAERIWETVRSVESGMGGAGRVLVRASGTEPLIRVMVEAEEMSDAQAAAQKIAAVVTEELGR